MSRHCLDDITNAHTSWEGNEANRSWAGTVRMKSKKEMHKPPEMWTMPRDHEQALYEVNHKCTHQLRGRWGQEIMSRHWMNEIKMHTLAESRMMPNHHEQWLLSSIINYIHHSSVTPPPRCWWSVGSLLWTSSSHTHAVYDNFSHNTSHNNTVHTCHILSDFMINPGLWISTCATLPDLITYKLLDLSSLNIPFIDNHNSPTLYITHIHEHQQCGCIQIETHTA